MLILFCFKQDGKKKNLLKKKKKKANHVWSTFRIQALSKRDMLAGTELFVLICKIEESIPQTCSHSLPPIQICCQNINNTIQKIKIFGSTCMSLVQAFKFCQYIWMLHLSLLPRAELVRSLKKKRKIHYYI